MTTMIIIIITINETEYGKVILRKELAQIESQGELGQLWWIPLSWTMTMVKGSDYQHSIIIIIVLVIVIIAMLKRHHQDDQSHHIATIVIQIQI